MKVADWIKKNTHSLCGKSVAISGATGGIGKELCRHFAALGVKRIVMLNRNEKKTVAFEDELRADFPSLVTEHLTVDMENMDGVRSVADRLCEDGQIDYLVLNAGAYSIPRHKCSTGYDNVFQINFVSPYYLALRLLPSIKDRGGKVIAVASIAHGYSRTNMNDIDFSNVKKASKVYGNAKRFLMYSLWGLEEYLDNIVIAHPGITFTDITAHYPKVIFAIIKYPMKVIFMKPQKAALSILFGAFSTCAKNEWIGPRLFDVWGFPKKKLLRSATPTEASDICKCAEGLVESGFCASGGKLSEKV